jgi:hypothetical protein
MPKSPMMAKYEQLVGWLYELFGDEVVQSV